MFLDKTEPSLIITQHSGDINIDYDLTQRDVITATRALPGSKLFDVLACEVLSTTEFGPVNRRLQSHLYVRLTEDDANGAIDALVCYENEIRSWRHPRSSKALKYQLRLSSADCGAQDAEVFEV